MDMKSWNIVTLRMRNGTSKNMVTIQTNSACNKKLDHVIIDTRARHYMRKRHTKAGVRFRVSPKWGFG